MRKCSPISPNSFRKVLIGLGISAGLLSPNYVFATSLETYENQSVAAVQQARKITGTLTDAVGEPIIGATVLEKGNPSNGTITDINGKFSLSVHPNAVISISYIGYITQNIKITNQTSLKVVMMDDTQALEEVVVVGYGSQKKANLTGAVSSVKMDGYWVTVLS